MIIWLATQEHDNPCYNVMKKSKSEIIDFLQQYYDRDPDFYKRYPYNNVYKLEINYSNVFDLLDGLLGEDGGKDQYMGKRLAKFIPFYSKNKMTLSKIQFDKYD